MILIILPLTMIAILVVVEWKTAALRNVLASLTDRGERLAACVIDEHGAYGLLPEKLPYREFHSDGIVETNKGILWCGIEIRVPATDGHSHGDSNSQGDALTRCLSGLPAGTHVQVINRLTVNSEQAIQVLETAKDQASAAFAAVYQARIEFLRREAEAGRLRDRQTWVFVGIEPRSKALHRRISWRAAFSPSPWIDLEQSEYVALCNKLGTLRQALTNRLIDAVSTCRNLSSTEIMALAYEHLNPVRSAKHPAPRYEQDVNPRELICCTNLEVKGEVLYFGDRPAATLSLHRLPIKVSPKTIEGFYRSTAIDFPLEVSSHFRIEHWLNYDRKLDRDEKEISRRMTQSSNPDEDVKLDEIQTIRRQLREGEEKIGPFGLAITLHAPDEAELRRRVDIVLAEIRKSEGLELVWERTKPDDQYLATLPCASHRDRRTKPVLSRHAALMMGLSGAPVGLNPQEAALVFQRSDGGVVLFDQTTRRHNVNHAIICGLPGSGKSVLLILLRFDHLAHGRRGFVIDYRTSGRRLVELVGGLDIDITNPASAPFLVGLFDIWPRDGERFEPQELTAGGLPRNRLFEVEELLAKLCGEKLDQPQRLYLNDAIARTYLDVTAEEVPTMDDFLRRICNPKRDEREIAKWLGERLGIYRSGQTLGLYFNQQGKAFDFSDAPLINFDFASSKGDPKLILVGTLAAKMVIDRALFSPRARRAGTFLQVDEFGMLAQSPLLASTVDDLVRTARKYNMHITLASQRAADFVERENIRNIALDIPVRYVFKMPAAEAQKAFHLTLGQARMVEALNSGGSDYRECALVSPSTVARLQLRLGAVEGRLFMEASTGSEKFTAAEALRELGGDPPTELVKAIELDPRATLAQLPAA